MTVARWGGGKSINAIPSSAWIEVDLRATRASALKRLGQHLEAAVAEIGSNRVSYCVADVSRPEDNDNIVRVAEERYGGVDVLVANAGIEGQVKPITEY